MNMMNKLGGNAFSVTLVIVSALMFARVAQAETVNCTAITALPHTITTSGTYCLTGSLSTSITSGTAIRIDTDDVALDLNGFTLDGSGGGAASIAHGISSYGRSNITVRNGTLKGFYSGAVIHSLTAPYDDARANIVEDLRVTGSLQKGIVFSGTGSIVRRNIVSNTGGTTTYPSLPVYGIHVRGAGNLVTDNRVLDTDATLEANTDAAGIYITYSPGLVIRGNTVSNTVASGTSYGIRVNVAGASLLRGNVVHSADIGLGLVSISDKYMENISDDVITQVVSGKDVAHNN